MTNTQDDNHNPSRRAVVSSGAVLLGATNLLLDIAAPAQAAPHVQPLVAPGLPPAAYNILFILVDQEHFFEDWPMPVPGREWIKKNGITFTNHQAASCVCSPARSTIYTGQHIQHTRIFDNANSLWQADMSTKMKTIGHRMASLGYHASYQGKWHLSINLDQVKDAIDAPLLAYRKIIESYGFDDFFGVGDINDRTLGGYNYDDTTTAFVTRWLRTKAQELRALGKPWFLAVNFVNPHDVMFVDSDLPGETVQGKVTAFPIARPPADDIYRAEWNVRLPATRSQPFDAPGRPRGIKSIKRFRTFSSAPGQTRTAAGGCCATIITTASATVTHKWLASSTRSSPTAWTKTPSSFSPLTMANSVAIIRCAARATAPTDNRTICH